MKLRVFPYPGGVAAMFRSLAHETQIAQDESEREAMFNAGDIHGGVAVTRLSLRATFVKPAQNLAILTDLPPDRLRSARLTDLLVTRDRAMANEHLEAVFGLGERRRFQSSMLTNRGDELPVYVGLAPVREGFKIVGAMMLLTVLDAEAVAGARSENRRA